MKLISVIPLLQIVSLGVIMQTLEIKRFRFYINRFPLPGPPVAPVRPSDPGVPRDPGDPGCPFLPGAPTTPVRPATQRIGRIVLK